MQPSLELHHFLSENIQIFVLVALLVLLLPPSSWLTVSPWGPPWSSSGRAGWRPLGFSWPHLHSDRMRPDELRNGLGALKQQGALKHKQPRVFKLCRSTGR